MTVVELLDHHWSDLVILVVIFVVVGIPSILVAFRPGGQAEPGYVDIGPLYSKNADALVREGQRLTPEQFKARIELELHHAHALGEEGWDCTCSECYEEDDDDDED